MNRKGAAVIELDNVSMRAGSFYLDRITLSVPSGAYVVLMGNSGAGKTTILEGICGLRPILSGRILLDGTDVTALRAGERGVGYVPQDGALFPSMTVADQLSFALRVRHRSADEIAVRVKEVAVTLELESLLNRYPSGLSGGEAQRVALGRALAFQPRILCLDEPMSALDGEARAMIASLLQRIHRTWAITVLHVTHGLDEARQLGENVLRLDRGVIIQEESVGQV